MIRHLLAALLALTLSAGAVQAQAPAQATPPGRGTVSAEEMEMQRMLQGGRIEGRVFIPDARAASLIQRQGREWREFHNRTLAWVGGVAVLGILGLLLAFFGMKGRIPIPGGASGRTVMRFTLLERANHWMVAACFIILGLTGLNLTFGRHLLLPLVGPEAFTAVSLWGKVAHNYLAFPFTLGITVMLLLWAKDNIPERRDIDWLKLGGGFFGKGHPVAGRFNAGQKMDLYRLGRDGGGFRRHGLRPGELQLGQGASRPLGRGRGGEGPRGRPAARRPRRGRRLIQALPRPGGGGMRRGLSPRPRLARSRILHCQPGREGRPPGRLSFASRRSPL
jgi:formate dehydrogenase subunit gamma